MDDLFQVFEFMKMGEPRVPIGGGYIAEIPEGIHSAGELLSVLSKTLHFPAYFGHNWNALSDCLRDLHWMSGREIVLVHRDLPLIEARDRRTYIEVLAEAVESWKPDENHRLRVVFPLEAKDEVLHIMAGGGSTALS